MQDKKIIYLNPEEEKNTQKKHREKTKKHRILRKLPYAFIAALLIFAAVVLLSVRQGITVETVKVSVSDFFKGESLDKNYPIKTNGLKVETIEKIGDSIGVLNDVRLSIYSPRGRLTNEIQHNMIEPRMITSKTRALIFEHGNRKIIVASLTKNILTKQYESEILAADMNIRNNFAVALLGDRYLSEVHIYNSDGDEKLAWYSADNYVLSVSISPNSSQFAVALFNTVNGDNVGSVYIIDVKNADKPLAQFNYEGETIYSVKYTDDGTLTAIGDTATYFYDEEGKTIGEYAYDGEEISYFDLGIGKSICLGLTQVDGTNHIISVDKTGEIIAQMTFSGDIDYLSSEKDGIYLISESKIYAYSQNKNELVLDFTLEDIQGPIRLVSRGGRLFVLTQDGIQMAEK